MSPVCCAFAYATELSERTFAAIAAFLLETDTTANYT
jgi:hypothetical protein